MRELLANRRFLIFWLGQAVSTLGDGMTPIALAALVIKHHGAGGFGTVLACYAVGSGVPILFAGVIADRYPRGLVMAVGDLMALGAVLSYLVFFDALPLFWLAVLGLLAGVGKAVYTPAFRAAVPQMIEPDQLRVANSLQSMSNRGMWAAGAALAGVLVAVGGARWAFAVDTASFAVSVSTLLMIRLPKVERTVATTNVVREAVDGFREAWRRPWVAVVMLQGTVQVLFGYAPMAVLLPLVLTERFGGAAYGVVAVFQGVGSVLGGVVMLRFKPRREGLWAMHALAPGALLLACVALPVPLWVFIVAQVACAMGINIFFTLWLSALGREFPQEVQGRVFSLDSMLTFLFNPLGLAVTPWAATLLGVPAVAAGAAVVLLIGAYAVLVVPGVSTFVTPPKPSTPDLDKRAHASLPG